MNPTTANAHALLSTVEAFLASVNQNSERFRRLELVKEYLRGHGSAGERYTLDEMLKYLEQETLPAIEGFRADRRLPEFCKDLFYVAKHGLGGPR